MKLLIYQWDSYIQSDLYEICSELGVDYDVFRWDFKDKNTDEEFDVWFESNVNCNKYDTLLSVNYYPVLSNRCKHHQMKYIAWCYDAPLNVKRIEETLANENNYVFFFDRIQYLEYYKQGFRTVYHLPLGVNATRLSRLTVTKKEHEIYDADVSFVGKMYHSHIQELMNPLNDFYKGYLKGVMDMQDQIFGTFFLGDSISNEMMVDINIQHKNSPNGIKMDISKEALIFAMASEITRRNRLIITSLCSNRYSTIVYTNNENDVPKNAKWGGTLDYISEMPQMFNCTKINLNPTLRIIKSGIPLRAFDIMGAGGFLLSSWQEELVELFENEKEMVVYDSYEDAIEKINFYLKHDGLRENIATKGRNKTLSEYGLQDRLRTILKVIEE